MEIYFSFSSWNCLQVKLAHRNKNNKSHFFQQSVEISVPPSTWLLLLLNILSYSSHKRKLRIESLFQPLVFDIPLLHCMQNCRLQHVAVFETMATLLLDGHFCINANDIHHKHIFSIPVQENKMVQPDIEDCSSWKQWTFIPEAKEYWNEAGCIISSNQNLLPDYISHSCSKGISFAVPWKNKLL